MCKIFILITWEAEKLDAKHLPFFSGTPCSLTYLREGLKKMKRLFAGTVPANKNLFAGTVTANKNLFAGTIPANKNLIAGTCSRGGTCC